MITFLFRKLLALLLVILGVVTILFFVNEMIPGDPIRAFAGVQVRPEQVEILRREFGLDKPAYVRYIRYLFNLARGDLGISLSTQQPVVKDLKQHLPASIELTVLSMVLIVVIGVPVGVISAVKKGRAVDQLTRILAFIGAGLPVFWFGLMLQLFLYGRLALFPAAGRIGFGLEAPVGPTGLLLLDSLIARRVEVFSSAARHLVLPVLSIALARVAVVARMTRSSMLEVLSEDYIRTARAKGLAERRIVFRHALMNAFMPTLTILGLQFGWVLQGAVLVEAIFSYPGIGFYAVRAITHHDLPAILGVTLVMVVVFVISNFITDLLYTVVDPRVRV